MWVMGRIRFALVACLTLVLLTVVPAAHAQSPEPRVVGGSQTTIEEYPWQAAVVFDPSKEAGNAHDRQFCGGSVVTAYVVLTAAHCIEDTDPDNGTSLDPSDVNVVLGRTTLSNEGQGTEHDVQIVDFDSNFDPNTLENDVGYLVLSTALPQPQPAIDIAGSDEAAVWAPGVVVEISGWGSTFFGGNTVDTLMAGSVPIVSDTTCGSVLVYGSDFDQGTMVCAGYMEGGVDTCQGDSGGPLESPLENGDYRLVGITSWGIGCALPSKPGVYTRVAGDTLRPTVASKIFDLETAAGLAHENVIGSGGQPRSGDPPPPPSGGGQPASETVIPTPTANDPYLKCHKLKSKKKRKRCLRKVRARLGQ
jgi:secreted trypsin-like serine protease